MDNEKFEKKQLLEIEAYNTDMKYDQLSEDEKNIIFAVSLFKFNLKLSRNDLREVVKVEIHKAACREIGNNMGNYSKKAKNLLLYYRFGSSRKKKKYNYLMQLRDEATTKMYDLEKIPKTISEMNSTIGFRIARKYQIMEIFWEDNVISETTKHRARIWAALYKIRGDIKYKTNKWKLKHKKK
jgi:phenylalanyl-tRNA synthetase alpha subunit